MLPIRKYWLVDKSINNQQEPEESSTEEQPVGWNSAAGREIRANGLLPIC